MAEILGGKQLNPTLEITTNYQNKNFLYKAFREFKRSFFLQMLVLPGVVYFILFHYIPMYGVVIAFQNFRIRSGILGSEWVGLEQFIKFIQNPMFFRLVRNTVLLSVYSLLFGFAPPIILALFLNEPMNRLYRKFVQTVSYLPHFISIVAVVGMLFMLLSPQGGLINNLIYLLGIEPIYFLARREWFRFIYIFSGIWQSIGFSAIIYLAALSGVDTQMYEASTIDGASRVQKMWHISLPSIQPTIVILLIFSIGGMMSVNTEKVLLMQLPLTYEVSDVIGTYVYRRGLIHFEYSYGAAVGFFNSLINIILLIIANALAKRYTETSLW